MLHWLKGHRWVDIGAHCDRSEHYVRGKDGVYGYYLVTHVTQRCSVCGRLKQQHLLGAWKVPETRDTLTEAISYLERA